MSFPAVGIAARFRALRAAEPTEADGLHPTREPGAEHLGDERRALGHYLSHLGAEEAAALFTNAGAASA